MKKVILGLLMAMFMLGGCTTGNKTTDNVVQYNGILQTKSGEEYILKTESGDLVNITSNKENLDKYLKKNIQVKGMFSGTTLYVDEIE